MKRAIETIGGLGFLVMGVLPAHAHPALVRSTPEADATVSSPEAVRLYFNEILVGRFSGAAVKTADGALVKPEAAFVDAQDPKQLVVALRGPLAPGLYTVDWHAVAQDTHRVKGSFSFTIRP